MITLTVAMAALPEGWVVLRDAEGKPYYLHQESNLRTQHHPLAIGAKMETVTDAGERQMSDESGQGHAELHLLD